MNTNWFHAGATILSSATPTEVRQRGHTLGQGERAPTLWPVVLMAVAAYLTFLLYLTGPLQFSMFRSDVQLYWRDSLHLTTPFSTWWVPGYSALIALVRVATFGLLPPLAVMWLISGASYAMAVRTVAALANELGLRSPRRIAMLFAMFPVVGLTYSVWPIADITAMALFLLCVLSLERRRWVSLTIYAACALMVHKSMWYFLPPLLVLVMIRHRETRLVLPLAGLPLFCWMVAGAIHYADPLWFVRWGVNTLLRSRGAVPVFDGLIGPVVAGGAVRLVKVILVLGIAATAVVTLIRSLRLGYVSGMAVAVALLVMALSMNQMQIWVVVRYSKLLVVPAAYVFAHTRLWNAMFETPWIYAAIMTGCIGSNVAFGYYVVKSFFA